MAGIDGGDGLAAAAKRMEDRAARLRDLSPALKVIAADIHKRTLDAFRSSTSPAGEIWPTLAPRTQAARAAKLPGAKRRSKKTGKLTDAARAKRAQGVAAYRFGASNIFKPLMDTGRMRNSVRVIADIKSIEFGAVNYMGPHITGSENRPNRPPKRNPTVFEKSGDGLQPIPDVRQAITKTVGRYVATGEVR